MQRVRGVAGDCSLPRGLLAALPVFLVLAGPGSSTPAAPQPPEPLEDSRQTVLVRRVHRPVIVEPRRQGGGTPELCSAIAPEQIEVFEDGQPLRVTAVGPRLLPRVHALLIDTSGSMLGNLETVRRAAVGYIDSLPPDEAVLVASFDDSLVLGSAPTTDRDLARGAVRRLGNEVGSSTALWDALVQLGLYLDGLPGEKVLVLLSDGIDVASLEENGLDRVLGMTARMPNLTIFPIHLDPHESERREIERARGDLAILARRSGGELFRIEAATQLAGTFERIRRRLDQRLYVSYVPAPGDLGAGGEPERGGRSWRSVKIRAKKGLPCRVQMLGAARRFDAGAAARDDASRDAHRFVPTEDGTRLVGRTRDLVRDKGPLYSPRAFLGSGRLRGESRVVARFATREITVELPTFEALRTKLTGPERVLLHLLERDLPAPRTGENGELIRPPFLVHGQTFLELREPLGRALFERLPEYRAWALKAVEPQIDAEIELLAGGLPSDTREMLRRALVQRESDPASGRAHLLLADWLGDAPLADVVRDLERLVCNRLLASADSAPTVADTAEASWLKLRGWFSPAAGARLLTPLVPASGAGGERIGFYRIVLPWPRPFAGRPWLPPVRPLALITTRWLLERREIADAIGNELRIVSLDYPSGRPRWWKKGWCPAGSAEARRSDRGRGRLQREVALGLAPVGADAERITLTAHFLGPSGGEEPGRQERGEPVCLTVEAAPGASAATDRIASELARLLADRGRLLVPFRE